MEETELIDESLLNPSLDINKYFDLLDRPRRWKCEAASQKSPGLS